MIAHPPNHFFMVLQRLRGYVIPWFLFHILHTVHKIFGSCSRRLLLLFSFLSFFPHCYSKKKQIGMVWLRHSCAPLSNGMLLTSCLLCTCSVWRRQNQFSHTLKSVNWMEKQSKKLEMDKQTLRTHFRSENKLFCHSTEMMYSFFISIPFSMSIFVSCIIYASNHWISFSLIGSMKLFMMLCDSDIRVMYTSI